MKVLGKISNRGGIHCIDTVDSDGDGKMEIAHSLIDGGEYSLQVIRRDGSPVRSFRVEEGSYQFSLCTWPGASGGEHIIFDNGTAQTLKVYSLEGELIMEPPAPPPLMTYGIYTASVCFNEGESECLAVLFQLRYRRYDYAKELNRAALMVYNPEGEIVYAEMIGQQCMSIAVVSDLTAGTSKLLVGGDGEVLVYSTAALHDRGGRQRPAR